MDAPLARSSAPEPGPLAEALEPVLGPVTVEGLERLTGGASRETWAFSAVAADGHAHELILRRDPPGRRVTEGSMSIEAAAARVSAEAGLRVPEILLTSEAPSPWQTAGILMRRVDGETVGRRILRDDAFAGAREHLAEDCGVFLAGLHTIDPERAPTLPREDTLTSWRKLYRALRQPSPTFERALRWLDAHRPPERPGAIVHGDFRLGNLLVGPDGLEAVIDWELTHVGDPLEDLGWLCVKAWRFGADLPVGGFATRRQLLDAYAAAGGGDVSLEDLHWWEVFSTLKWGIGCMAQTSAHLRGDVVSVELAAVGRRVCEQEWDLIELLNPAAADRHRQPPTVEPDAGTDLHGRPSTTELLHGVAAYLRDDVQPLQGRVGYLARVAANVVDMVKREIEMSPAQAALRAEQLAALGVTSEAELAQVIESGTLDSRLDEVDDVIASGVAARLTVANPRHFDR